jgi:hypothetical protein
MKRSERVSAIVKILSDSPNQSYSLGTFCQMPAGKNGAGIH